MNKLLSPLAVLVIILAALLSLLNVDDTWAAADSSSQRQTVPPLYRIYLPLITKNYAAPAPLWRFGVATVRRGLVDYDPVGIVFMRFGWYVDFTATANPSMPYGMEYVPTVRIKQDKLAGDGVTKTDCRVGPYYVTPYEYTVSPSISQIQSIAASHPGMTWLIGNEMERIDWGSGYCAHQDEMLPEVYAQAYHDLYTAIKTVDPTAQIAIGGMVEFTDLRRQYLERVWNEYTRLFGQPMPVDVWNIHLYVLQEVQGSWGADIPAGFSETSGAAYTVSDNGDFSKVWAQVLDLRNWMKAHGQQNKPLIITEYGVNMPSYYPGFSAAEVRDRMMYPSFDSFLNTADASLGYPADGNRLVQRWNWWSVDADDGACDGSVFYENFGGSLFDSGLGPSSQAASCSFPPQGLSPLGTYWKEYVQALPPGASTPYVP